MRFIWDEEKNRRNLAKHRISFETAKLVFNDPHAISRLDRIVGAAQRWPTLGLIGPVVIVLVAHTHQDQHGEKAIRIISARKATPHERRQYEQGH